MNDKQIIMNFTMPPGLTDFEVIANEILQSLPDELIELCEDLNIQIEDFPDDAMQADLDLDDPYDLLIVFKSGKELSPGIEKKTADGDDVLMLFRRPILDMWCETCDDLGTLIRDAMIEELGKNFDFSEDEVDEMTGRHYQGML